MSNYKRQSSSKKQRRREKVKRLIEKEGEMGFAGGGGGQILKRIPRIKFPQRHPKSTSSSSGSISQTQAASINTDTYQFATFKSDVPAPPSNTAVGGKAVSQPKRTPVSEREIEAIQLGGIF